MNTNRFDITCKIASRCPSQPIVDNTIKSSESKLAWNTITYTCKNGFRLPMLALQKKFSNRQDLNNLSTNMWTKQSMTCNGHNRTKLLFWEGTETLSDCEPQECKTPKEEFTKAQEKDLLLKKETYTVFTKLTYTCVNGKKVEAHCSESLLIYDGANWTYPLSR